LGVQSDKGSRGWRIIAGGVMSGLSVAALGLTSAFVGSFELALVIMFAIGICNITYTTSIQTSLQMLVPDHMRGRVMGFYGMTHNLMPLGGMLAGALASVVTAPLAIVTGGLAVTAFIVGPVLLNGQIRHLGTRLQQIEVETAGGPPRLRSCPSSAGH
jgi:MFS family permease